MKLTYHGHSCFELQTADCNVIIDPFLSGNPLAVIKAEDVRVQYILVTHGHADHVGDAEAIARNNDATIIAPYELAVYFAQKGLKIHPMQHGGKFNFPFGTVKLTLAFHGSAIEVDGKFIYAGNPGGFVITAEGKTIYHAGDTALFSDMKLIGERHDVDMAILPIGDNFTMGPEDALEAAKWVKAKRVVPMHYNTFDLIKQDAEAFSKDLAREGIEGVVLAPGQSVEV